MTRKNRFLSDSDSANGLIAVNSLLSLFIFFLSLNDVRRGDRENVGEQVDILTSRPERKRLQTTALKPNSKL